MVGVHMNFEDDWIMILFWKVSASDTVSEGGNEQTTRGNLTIEVWYYIFFISWWMISINHF